MIAVIDASLIAKYLLREEGWEKAREVLLSRDCYTLEHALVEATNAIWRHAKLLGLISRRDALEKLLALERLAMDAVTIEPAQLYLHRGLEIALETNITIYDAIYIAQAEHLHALLATADRRQAAIARGMGINTIYIE